MKRLSTLALCTCAAVLAAALLSAGVRAAAERPGILLMAHGGSASWNGEVRTLAARLAARTPTAVALGMAQRAAIQSAIERLQNDGATAIVAVPLFVSSHSSVIESTRYLLGLAPTAPADLALFARMNHGATAASPHHADNDGTAPVDARVPIRMAGALDRHPIVADILASRARAISRTPASEVAILVAHGPAPEADNQLWLADMQVLANRVADAMPFARVEHLTVRDDAPAPVRDAAAAELRALVERVRAEGRTPLVVPLLLSYGGIEQGIRKRLDGLDYVMATQGLMPDDRVEQWVLESAGLAAR